MIFSPWLAHDQDHLPRNGIIQNSLSSTSALIKEMPEILFTGNMVESISQTLLPNKFRLCQVEQKQAENQASKQRSSKTPNMDIWITLA